LEQNRPLLRWYNELKNDKEREEFKSLLALNQKVFDRFLSLIQEMDTEIERSEFKASDFDDPSWSHKQAFRNGQRSQLKRFKDILTFVNPKG